MRKKVILGMLILVFFLMVISCAPASEEELKTQVAAQLQNLSNEELQQLAEQTEEGKAIAGQVYQIGSVATAGRVLNRLPAGSRQAIIQRELGRRTNSIPCRSNSDCVSPQICGVNEANEDVCENPNQPVDSRCRDDNECASGLRCSLDEVRRARICTPLLSWGAPCTYDLECYSYLCGMNNAGQRVCESPYTQAINSRCVSDAECVSSLICGIYEAHDSGAEISPPMYVGSSRCELRNQPRGSICGQNGECASGICNFYDEPNRNFFGECT